MVECFPVSILNAPSLQCNYSKKHGEFLESCMPFKNHLVLTKIMLLFLLLVFL